MFKVARGRSPLGGPGRARVQRGPEPLVGPLTGRACEGRVLSAGGGILRETISAGRSWSRTCTSTEMALTQCKYKLKKCAYVFCVFVCMNKYGKVQMYTRTRAHTHPWRRRRPHASPATWPTDPVEGPVPRQRNETNMKGTLIIKASH